MTGTDIEDVLALSPLQLGLFSHTTLLGPGAEDPYVIAMSADITGPLDVSLLRDCAATMLSRHPNLRVSFWHDDLPRPVQIVPATVDVPWRQARASAHQAPGIEEQERARPFDLAHGPLIRFLLIELPEQHWRLVITAHHIVIDGWSLPVFIGELLTLYRHGGTPDVLAPPRLYRDYIGWLAGRDPRADERVWRRHLSGLPGPSLLSPELGGPGAGLPGRTEITLPVEDTEHLAAAARARGLTLNTVLQMAWALILSRLTGRDDVVFGVTVSGRPSELTGVETMVGLFINTIPLRVRLDPSHTVAQHCSSLQGEAAELRDHSYLTHGELRSLAGVGEMFDSLLVYESFPPGDVVGGQEFTAGPVTFRPTGMESLTHFPVTVAAHRSGAGLTLMVEVTDGALGSMTPDVLGRRILSTMRSLVDRWDAPLGRVSIAVDDGTADRAVVTPPATRVCGGVAEHFAKAAAQHADSLALRWSGGELTYRELDERSDRLAGLLAEAGVCRETPVAIRLSRGGDYVIAMLGVLKAGGMYVPLEPTMPPARTLSMMAQCGATIVIDGNTMAAALQAPRLRVPALPDQAAYVVFTSGTTGEPKGVIGTHRALLAYIDDHADRMLRPAAEQLGRRLRIGHAWSFAFDAAWQPLAGLLFGHSVHIVDEDDRRDADALVRIVGGHGIDMLDVTPSLFGHLRQAGLLEATALKVLALGGEAVGSAEWDDIRKSCAQGGLTAHNCYGPTEATVEAVVAAIGDHEAPVIGYPTRGSGCAVLDAWLHPVPDGVVGELYLTGHQLTRGYLGRSAETATRFVATAGGGRMYRTGDLVRRNADGALTFLGRADAQIQVRGHRVEPGEIEAVLAALPGVRHVHVAVHPAAAGPRLIAYLVGEAAVPDLRAELRNRLPRYMRPHRVVVVDTIPLTMNGKVDEAALAAMVGPEDTSAPPRTPTEITLARAVADLLSLDEVDIDADLLELGLDSIVALSVAQIARRDGLALPARLILESGTTRELAAAVDRGIADDSAAGPEPQGPVPALPNAHWLYEHGDPRRLAQVQLLALPEGTDAERLRVLLDASASAHEMLCSRIDLATMTFRSDGPGGIPLTEIEVAGDPVAATAEHAAAAIERLDPQGGCLVEALWLHRHAEPGVLVLAAQVLAMDPSSWRIVLGELAAGLQAPAGLEPMPEQMSYRRWAARAAERVAALDTMGFWLAQLDGEDPALGARRIRPGRDRARDLQVTATVTDAELTGRLFRGQRPIQDALADACARMIDRWRAARAQPAAVPLLALETHGRAGGADDTVGLLSAIYPLRVQPGRPMPEIDGYAQDYALLRYWRADTAERLRSLREPQVLLNYLGRVDGLPTTGAPVSMVPEPNAAVRHELTLIGAVSGGQLVTQWRTVADIFSPPEVTELQSLWQDALREVAR
ncbi:non-ribosomal peptide synthetase [Mycobacterium sp. DL592]|uniref:non-ribosomal peptide synthetase n=1 Tax=Mycobacterium sp. DL592 TaxID=2675524 RepID=UPI0014238424|nr:non-ribosomal peptide synthetase [Mycobacterium sp. DL592]